MFMNVRINMWATMNGLQIAGQYNWEEIRGFSRRKPYIKYAPSRFPIQATGRIYPARSVAPKCKCATQLANNKRVPSMVVKKQVILRK